MGAEVLVQLKTFVQSIDVCASIHPKSTKWVRTPMNKNLLPVQVKRLALHFAIHSHWQVCLVDLAFPTVQRLPLRKDTTFDDKKLVVDNWKVNYSFVDFEIMEALDNLRWKHAEEQIWRALIMHFNISEWMKHWFLSICTWKLILCFCSWINIFFYDILVKLNLFYSYFFMWTHTRTHTHTHTHTHTNTHTHTHTHTHTMVSTKLWLI